jgi:Transglutaminase-like superfamily
VITRSLRRFLRLSRADRSLLTRSIVLLAAARIALWTLPFNVARRLMTRTRRPMPVTPATAERIGWAISVAKRFVPGGNCLPQALTAESLLLQCGHPVAFRIGVMKTSSDRLEAHAWVESNGHLVVGDLDAAMANYSPLPPLPAARI